MWFLLSLLSVCAVVAGLTGPGSLVVDACLPFRQRPAARLFLSPLLGLALLLLPATLLGWFGGGFRWWICLPLTLGLVSAGRWRRTLSRHGSIRQAATLAAFCALASFPLLGQIFLCRAFDPFNDAFFYLVQAQWLQGHGFAETVQPSGFYPAWAQVATFQQTSLRMGPSFLLGWWQAAAGVPWSYQAYPAAASLMLVMGGLAVGGAVLAVCPGWRRAAWLAALIAAVGRNGFAYGPTFGFLPQTCGLAFAAGTLALRGLEMASPVPPTLGPIRQRLRAGFPLALLAAAVVFCYPEAFPFLVAAWLASHTLHPTFPRSFAEWRVCFARTWPTALLVVSLVNVEWVRVWEALRIQAHVVAGFPVDWPPWEFAAHSLGLRAPYFAARAWLWHVRWFHCLLTLPFVAGFAWLLCPQKNAVKTLRSQPQALLPLALQLAGFAAAFAWFRYAVANPWPQGLDGHPPGLGQTWSQFKLSTWASLAAVALTVGGLLAVARRWQVLATGLLLVWAVTELAWSVHGLGHPTRAFRHAVGVSADPFAKLLTLRDVLAAVPKDDVVYLDFQGDDFESLKTRELPVYFLSDRRLAGNWAADPGLLAHLLPEDERNLPVTQADWIMHASRDNVGGLHFELEQVGRRVRGQP